MSAARAAAVTEAIAVRSWRPNDHAIARALVVLSAAGSLAAMGLLLGGETALALRVLAGDVLLLAGLLACAARG